MVPKFLIGGGLGNKLESGCGNILDRGGIEKLWDCLSGIGMGLFEWNRDKII